MIRVLMFTLALITLAIPVHAEVVERSPSGFSVKTVVTIAARPERVFDALVNEIHVWWDNAHTFSGDAGNLWLTPNPGGCLCETLGRGGGVEHLVVTNVVVGELLRFRGALGPLQEHGVAGSLTWSFAPTGRDNTTATVTYNVGGFFPGGLDKVADAVDMVIGDQIRRLKAHAERPIPPLPRQ
jgi:uncharacterized protein YndB with AHSA1/START domain